MYNLYDPPSLDSIRHGIAARKGGGLDRREGHDLSKTSQLFILVSFNFWRKLLFEILLKYNK